MKDKITEAEMYHVSAQTLLQNGFCEGDWVTLYKRINQHPVSNEDVEYDLWYWRYVAQPSLSEDLLKNYEPDLEWNQRSALDINNHFIPNLKKGLECETVIVLDAHRFPDEKHLYVALSRCSQRLIVASETTVLSPYKNKQDKINPSDAIQLSLFPEFDN